MSRNPKPPAWDKGPWQRHDGGPCPVDPGALVEFRVSGSAKLSTPTRANKVLWKWEGRERWRVTAFRILTPPKGTLYQ